MFSAGNKAQHLSSVNHTTKTIHLHQHHHTSPWTLTIGHALQISNYVFALIRLARRIKYSMASQNLLLMKMCKLLIQLVLETNIRPMMQLV